MAKYDGIHAIDDKHLIKRIAFRIQGIHWDDLTTAERQIAELLIKAGYLTKDEEGNLGEPG